MPRATKPKCSSSPTICKRTFSSPSRIRTLRTALSSTVPPPLELSSLFSCTSMRVSGWAPDFFNSSSLSAKMLARPAGSSSFSIALMQISSISRATMETSLKPKVAPDPASLCAIARTAAMASSASFLLGEEDINKTWDEISFIFEVSCWA